MKKINPDEQKEISLNILKYVHSLCEANNIEYSLCGGTLLGAIRHKGFIPWDDDIDIFLVRKQYDRLINVLNEKDDYLLISPKTNKYYHAFSKLVDKRTIMKMDNLNEPPIPNLGVHIDIFPIDGSPSDLKEQLQHTKELRQIMAQMRLSMPNSYFDSQEEYKKKIKRILYFPKHIRAKNIATTDEWKVKLLNRLEYYPFEKSEFGGFVLSGYGIKEILPKKVFSGKISLKFEDDTFNVFDGYEEYLKAIYGNYWELPPEDKRKTLHHYSAYWKD